MSSIYVADQYLLLILEDFERLFYKLSDAVYRTAYLHYLAAY